MLPAKKIAVWADKLRDISALGQEFSKNTYDHERYQKIQNIAKEMLAYASNTSVPELEQIQIPYFSRPCPLVGGDAAVIDNEGKILLIQRTDNEKWAMPGGLLEVGESPVEGVVREVFEETGVKCQINALIGIFDSRLCGTLYPLHLYHVMFLGTPLKSEKNLDLHHKQESLNIQWFHEHSLPMDIDSGHVSRIPEAYRVWRGDERVFFDK